MLSGSCSVSCRAGLRIQVSPRVVPPPAQLPSQSLARVWSASGDLGEAGRRHYVGRKDRGLAPRVGVGAADGGAREKTAELQCCFGGRKQLPTMLELRRSGGPTAGGPVIRPPGYHAGHRKPRTASAGWRWLDTVALPHLLPALGPERSPPCRCVSALRVSLCLSQACCRASFSITLAAPAEGSC